MQGSRDSQYTLLLDNGFSHNLRSPDKNALYVAITRHTEWLHLIERVRGNADWFKAEGHACKKGGVVEETEHTFVESENTSIELGDKFQSSREPEVRHAEEEGLDQDVLVSSGGREEYLVNENLKVKVTQDFLINNFMVENPILPSMIPKIEEHIDELVDHDEMIHSYQPAQ